MEHTSEHVDLFRFQTGSIKSQHLNWVQNSVFEFLFHAGSIKGFQALYAPGAPEPLAPRGTG